MSSFEVWTTLNYTKQGLNYTKQGLNYTKQGLNYTKLGLNYTKLGLNYTKLRTLTPTQPLRHLKMRALSGAVNIYLLHEVVNIYLQCYIYAI
jgi:hypothetical protein